MESLLSYKLIWSIMVIIGVVIGDHLSQDILDQIDDALDGDCDSNAGNCLIDDPDGGSGNTNTITLLEVTSSGNSCCYKYQSVFDGTETCSGKRTSQSHWTLSYFCIDDGSGNGIASGGVTAGNDNTGSNPQLGVDSSTCYEGIKFDDACGGSNSPCIYEVCILWNSNLAAGGDPKCCTAPGWYLIKSGNEFGFDQVEVPACNCETDPPTKEPTSDPTPAPTDPPTKSPTPGPTSDPTKDPTSDPTTDPTVDPTRDPTTDPTKDPTSDPTADPTIDPTADPTADPTIDPTTDPTSDPTKDPTSDPTADPTKDPTSDPTADPTADPTTDPTSDPTKSPTPNCRPIIEINVNDGCTPDNLEIFDTDIIYTPINVYVDPSEIGSTFTTIPDDPLSEIILDQSCETDNPAAKSIPINENQMIDEHGFDNIENNGESNIESKNKFDIFSYLNNNPNIILIFSMIVTIYASIITCLYLRKDNVYYGSIAGVSNKDMDINECDVEKEEEENML